MANFCVSIKCPNKKLLLMKSEDRKNSSNDIALYNLDEKTCPLFAQTIQQLQLIKPGRE
jgi:hypothetical protein